MHESPRYVRIPRVCMNPRGMHESPRYVRIPRVCMNPRGMHESPGYVRIPGMFESNELSTGRVGCPPPPRVCVCVCVCECVCTRACVHTKACRACCKATTRSSLLCRWTTRQCDVAVVLHLVDLPHTHHGFCDLHQHLLLIEEGFVWFLGT